MSNDAKRDLSLFPGTYIFIQDGSKGVVKVMTGPTVITPSGADKPVIYDHKKGTFVQTATLEDAVRKSPVVVEGYYVELLNPAEGNKHPADAANSPGADLVVGRKINIPGPTMFALWPGQVATVIRGHHLRSNQYLLARVYNDEEAKKNWSNAVMRKASTLTPPGADATEEQKTVYQKALEAENKKSASLAPPDDLTNGKLFIIRGTDVSFFMPPTGITIVPESEDAQGNLIYVRDALTLERLEYAVLVDESGKKRYERGPAVVFPLPTERFIQTKEEKETTKKFRAIELNPIQGIHIKVIADYEENGKHYTAGEELFITGKDTPIYYPREEHAAIKYDGKTKHFATAVPAGEARYVLNRMTGGISLNKGPAMLMPDPRNEIFVRRVLSDRQVQLWYPNNNEALEYNRSLRSILANAPSTRAGALSEGDLERGLSKSARQTAFLGAAGAAAAGGGPVVKSSNLYASTSNLAEQSHVSKDQGYIGEEMVRASTYNQPRVITLEGKYQGAPIIELWTNYAALVISKSGGRRVEIGPKTIHLEYDESLEVLELSTGKPKTTDNLKRDVFLRIANNKISDKVSVETADHVKVEVYMSFLVNFEGESEKWFSVENYVKHLCDHVRSVLKGAVRKVKIEEFYANSTDLIRKIVLGEDKKGMKFEANGMRITDVEVLGSEIKDQNIRQMLDAAQIEVVKTNIEISNAHRNLNVQKEKENIKREQIETEAQTARFRNEIEQQHLASNLAVALVRIGNSLKEATDQRKLDEERQALAKANNIAKLELEKMDSDADLAVRKAEQEQKIELLKAEAEAIVTKFKAVEGNFTQALLSLSNNETLVQVAKAMNIQRVLGGDNIAETLAKAFPEGPLAPFVKQLTAGFQFPANGTTKQQASTNAG